MMKLIQHGVGPILDLHNRFGHRTKAWAERHGIQYVFSDRRIYEDRKPHWEKPLLVFEHMLEMGDDDQIMWLDPDTIVMRPEVSPESVLLKVADFALCFDKAETPFNSGMFIARCNNRVKSFFKDVIDKGPMSGIRYHDQARFCERMPFHPEMRIQFLHKEWNFASCTDWDHSGCENPIIRAFHGWQKDRAEKAMAILIGEEKADKEKLTLDQMGPRQPMEIPAFDYVNVTETGEWCDFRESVSQVTLENMGKTTVYFKLNGMPKAEFKFGQSHLLPGQKERFDKQNIHRIGLIGEAGKTCLVHVTGMRG